MPGVVVTPRRIYWAISVESEKYVSYHHAKCVKGGIYIPKHITRETKEALVKEYKERPVTIEYIAERYHISKPSVGKILAQNHVKPWSLVKIYSPDLEEHYFRDIDSHEKAYFLGLITTDGCVFWKNSRCAFLTITLLDKDKYILEEFMLAVKCNRKLVYNKKQNTWTATVSSAEMVKDLEKYGIHPNSSLTQTFCTDISDRYLPDYIRGIMDGDGSYGYYVRPRRNVHKKRVHLCSGSKVFLETFISHICSRLTLKKPAIKKEKNQNLFYIHWYANDDLETIISFIYSTDGPFLTRKKEIADRILSEVRQYRDNSRLAVS